MFLTFRFEIFTMESQINSLVYDYLESISSKVADKFKKEVKASALPVGSPRIKDIVNTFNNSPLKRKQNEITSPAKKAKKEESSSDDDSDSDSDEEAPKKVSNLYLNSVYFFIRCRNILFRISSGANAIPPDLIHQEHMPLRPNAGHASGKSSRASVNFYYFIENLICTPSSFNSNLYY